MKNMETPSASGSASKRLNRLNDLRQKVPHCSKGALEAILRDIADKGLPEAKSAKNMRAAADEALSDCNRFGDLLLPQEVTMKMELHKQLQLSTCFPLCTKLTNVVVSSTQS